ncbi:thermonuclease family protein [Pelagibius sp. Alg239-R121]|uniref:thermonuclease family protein n=1 Tax=Pelagibius sp. Alg239-R121 TaxID=2993448 RepID=UPI0024A6F7FA|nr:thermonuclease family protein [Pelagibius sp. Alg239-R121]
MKIRTASLLSVSLIFWAASPLHAKELHGVVTHVRDGDTIEVGSVPIRLNGLHAPELDTTAGKRAAEFMQNLVLHKSVVCRLTGKKSYDRFVAVCELAGRDIAAELVKAGLGRDCRRFSNGRYAKLETKGAKVLPLPGYCKPRS